MPMQRSTVIAISALLVAFCPIAGADSIEKRKIVTPTRLTSALVTDDSRYRTIDLSLNEAVARGVENNLEVEVERHAPLIAAENVSIAWGSYDPNFDAEVGYSSTKDANFLSINNTARNENYVVDGRGGIGALIPYINAAIGVSYDGNQQVTNSTLESISPKWQSGFDVTYSVPLLKDLVWNQAWTQIRTADTVYEGSQDQFRAALMDAVRNIELLYWQLIAREEQLRVAIKSLETSEALLDQTQTQYEVGVVSKVDVVEAEAGVAARELEVIKADARYRNSQDFILDAVFGTRLTAGALLQVNATDPMNVYDEVDVDPNTAVALAFQYRPELAVIEKEIETREISLRFAKNQRLPRFDVQGSYRVGGTDGRSNRQCDLPGSFCTPSDLDGSYGGSHDVWGTDKGDDALTVRGIFSIPLGNIAPRHTVSRAKLELNRSNSQLVQQKQGIILEVRTDIRLLKSARQGIDAAERQRVAAAEQLRAEKIRLEHGESTPFDVLLRERDLVDAEFEKIDALQIYRSAVSDLDRAQGTILRTHNIKLSTERELRRQYPEPESSTISRILEPFTPR